MKKCRPKYKYEEKKKKECYRARRKSSSEIGMTAENHNNPHAREVIPSTSILKQPIASHAATVQSQASIQPLVQSEQADVVMEAPKNLALCLVCNKDLGPLNQIPTFYHRPNVLFSRTPATSTLLRHKLESIVKDIVVFRSETCCLCVKCAGLINLADALEAELQSVCRQLTDHYWRTARLRGFGEERAVVCITPVQPRRPTAAPATAAGAAAGAAAGTAAGTAAGAAAGTAAGTAAGAAVPGGGPPSLLQQPGRPPVWTPQPAAGWAPQAGPPPGQPPAIWAGRPGPGQVTRSVSQDSDDASGVCQLLSAVEVELTEVKQEPGDELDVNNHLMRDPVDIEVDPWKDLGYEDANAVEKLASQKTRNMPPPSQFGQVRWPGQPPPWAAAPVGPLGAAPPAAPPGPRPTGAPPPPYSWPGSSPAAPRAPQPRTYGAHCRLDMSQVGRVPSAERPLPPPELPPGAQKTHQRIMKTLTSHSSAIQQAVANGVLSLEVRPPGTAAAAAAVAVAVAPAPAPAPGPGPTPAPTAAAAPVPAAKKGADRGGTRATAPPKKLPAIAPAPPAATAATASGLTPMSVATGSRTASVSAAATPLCALTPTTNFKIKLPSSTPRDGTSSPVPVVPTTPPTIDAPPALPTEAKAAASVSEEPSPPPPPTPPSRTVAWFHKSQRLRPGNYTYVKSGDSLNGKLIPFVAPKGRPRRLRLDDGPVIRLVVGTPMNQSRYPPLEKALALVGGARAGAAQPMVRPGYERRVVVAPDTVSSPAAATAAAASTSSPSPSAAGEKHDSPPRKRGPGRPRKDGLPPGSVKGRSARRGRRPGARTAAARSTNGRSPPAVRAPLGRRPGKRSAPETQPGQPAAKRARPESSDGRRHSRRLSARLSQPEEPDSPPAVKQEGEEPTEKQEPPKDEATEEDQPKTTTEPEPPKPDTGESASQPVGADDGGVPASDERVRSPGKAADSPAPPPADTGEDALVSGGTEDPAPPSADAGDISTPATEAESPAPAAESPEAKSPEAKSPEAVSPEEDSPEAESPEAESPEEDSPAAESPEADSPAAESPEAESPAPEPSGSAARAAESDATEASGEAAAS